MNSYTLSEILKTTLGKLLFKGAETFYGISIDSRTIKEGELFIALRGQRFDGHHFIDEALKKGAGAIVSYPPLLPISGKSVIHVNNTLKALQDIARHRRLRRRLKVIGITGTNGKTTTKEMIATILESSYKVLRSRGNLNNQIGLPLCLTELDDHDVAVLEMGASCAGDIRELSDIARPDIGVITNIGPAHLEGFGSIDMVWSTKLELFDFVKMLVINNDDQNLARHLGEVSGNEGKRIVRFGFSKAADVWADEIKQENQEMSFRLCMKDRESIIIKLSILGIFNVYNVLAASAVCHLLNIPAQDIKLSLESFSGVSMRLELKEMKGALIISDLYNANPSSMEEAVKELIRLRRFRAVAVLGDMLELGIYGEEAHRKLGRWMATLPVDVFIGVGELTSFACEEFSLSNGHKLSFSVKDPSEAREILMRIVNRNDTVLIKGSRGMRLEKVLEG